MKDIQSQHDPRRINIKKVGVKDISYPITVKDKAKKRQRTVARVNMYVNLPHLFKGTHMSRFIEILNQVRGEITLNSFHTILKAMRKKLQAEEAHMEIEFPYFLRQESAKMDNSVHIREYTCKMHGSLTSADKENLTLDITVPIFPPLTDQRDNLLPRSLGHWGEAMISLRFKSFIWIEDIITLVEEVTRHHLGRSACERSNPGQLLSVEQLTAELGRKLAEHPDISWFSVRIENLSEGHSTFASLDSSMLIC